MKRVVMKCDRCDTAIVDETFAEGAELWWKPLNKRGKSDWKNTLTWHFCKPCAIKTISRMTQKYGKGSQDDDD